MTGGEGTRASSPTGAKDVVFGFFSVSWAAAMARHLVMPEDQLAVSLVSHPEVRRLLVCNPYRSVLGRLAATARRGSEARFEATEARALYEPVRIRRTDPTTLSRAEAAVERYEAGMRRAADRLGMRRPHVITASPLLAGFGRFDWAGPVTYYIWDDWTASAPHSPWWAIYEAAHARIRDTGRRVCGVSEAAVRRVGPTGTSAVVPNGLQPHEWTGIGPPPAWFAEKPRPRLLYIGTVDGRVDVDQATASARAFPTGSLTFVGDVWAPEHFTAMRALPNVSFHDSVPRAELTSIIKAADVCLIPHVRNALTEAMSPLKLFEYLAGGRPVAAVDLPPIAAVEGRIVLVREGDAFPPAVVRALELGPAGEPERLRFVEANSWSRRFESLLAVALAERD